MLWWLGLVSAFLYSYRDDPHVRSGRGSGLVIAAGIANALFVFILVRGFLSKKRRELLFEQIPADSKPSDFACFFIRVVPLLGVVAGVLQWYLRT
jgi:hypothetical protein